MLDIKSIINYVERGTYPSNWRVFYGRYEAEYSWVIVLLVVFGLLFGFAFILSNLATLNPIWAIVGIVALCWVAVFLIKSGFLATSGRPIERSFLAILPLGIVEYDANYPDDVAWLFFPDIYRIELAQTMEVIGFDGYVGSRTYYWLNVFSTSGSVAKSCGIMILSCSSEPNGCVEEQRRWWLRQILPGGGVERRPGRDAHGVCRPK